MENSEENLKQANPRLNSSTGGFAYSAATICYIVASYIFAALVVFASLEQDTDAYIYLSYIAAPVAIALSIGVTLKVRHVGLTEVFPVKCNPKYYLIGFLLIFGLLFSLNWVNDLTVSFFELFGYVPRESSSYFPSLEGGLVVPALLVIAVLPAIFEEALFRGVILNSCEKSMGSVRAIFIVGFCFSLFHTSPEQTVYQFIAGCVFAFLAVRSRSVLPSVMMHFINNALIVVFAACGLLDEAGALAVSPDVNIALIVIGACALAGGLLWLLLDKTPLVKCEKGGVINFFIYASVGIILLAVIWICSLLGVS